MSSNPAVSSVVPWDQVCKMLEKVQHASRDNKKIMLNKFIDQYRAMLSKNLEKYPQAKDSFLPVLRILLPALDRERGAYGVKENKLARLYIRILRLSKDGVDAHKLLNYRKPKTGGNMVGDFAEVAYYVLKSRCRNTSSLSLYTVNNCLTSIAENYASKSQEDVEKCLFEMLNKMTAMEQKWFIRVLLKEMHLGIGQGVIFNSWHADAKEYYDVCNSLSKVCETLKNPETRLHEIEVGLFCPFRPMLAERAMIDKVEKQMNHKTFYTETKYDGERAQVHKKGSVYKYFSRNAMDFTSDYGGSPYDGIFTPYVHDLFLPNVKDVILDGEMIGWSKKYSTIISKGEHIDVKKLKEDGDWQVCFCVFDILYLNGEVLTNIPLKERLEKIPLVIKPLDGRVIISKRFEVKSREQVIAALNEAIDNREEGLVLKDPDSVYRPASRKAGWIKVKPEYVDSLVPELDLVIVGGYYGKGRRKGVISHFLLAAAVSSENERDKASIFHTISRVGSGYTVTELEEMLMKLTPYFTKKQPPNVLSCREKPDVWINPSKSCVVQIRAAELTKTEVYKTGITLRFPRVEKVRTDKSYYEILDTKELNQLSEDASGKLAVKHMLDTDVSPTKRKVMRTVHPSLPSYFRPADISDVKILTNLFQKKEFCVIDGDDINNKNDLEIMISKHGGNITQNPGENTHCIISNYKSIKVQNFINTGLYNVVKPCWVVNCVLSRKLLPYGPLDVVHLLEKEENKSFNQFDEYGNSYFEHIQVPRLKQILANMKNVEYELKKHHIKTLDELFMEDSDDLWGLFRLINAVFIDESKDVLTSTCKTLPMLNFRLHGGFVANSMNSQVTHVFVKEKTSSLKPSEFTGKHLLTTDWILKCIESKKLLEERHFSPIFSSF